MNLTVSDFKKLGIKDKEISLYLNWFNIYLDQFKINTPNRLIAFLMNLMHESANFYYVEEVASGSAYEGRLDLGNTQSGDGKRFKGRGLGQITGRRNYSRFTLWNAKSGDKTNFAIYPEKLKEPKYAVLSSFWFWEINNLEKHADKEDFTTVAAIWNTGNGRAQNVNGMRDRVDKQTIIENWLSSIVNENV